VEISYIWKDLGAGIDSGLLENELLGMAVPITFTFDDLLIKTLVSSLGR
jgi:hypothetical protein